MKQISTNKYFGYDLFLEKEKHLFAKKDGELLNLGLIIRQFDGVIDLHGYGQVFGPCSSMEDAGRLAIEHITKDDGSYWV